MVYLHAWMDMDEPCDKIDKEVLEMFEKAGADLKAQDQEGQTLLHLLVK